MEDKDIFSPLKQEVSHEMDTEEIKQEETEFNLEIPSEPFTPPEIDETEDPSDITEKDHESIADDPILERLDAIEETIKQNSEIIKSKLLYDTAKEEMINRLHVELQTYKDEFHKKIVKPIIMDMIVFGDNMKSLISRYPEDVVTEELSEKYQRLRKEFLKISSHIDDLIYNYGVESFSSKPGDPFNPRTQQAKRNITTDNPEENRTIVSSLTSGYRWDEQLLRRESVNVAIYEAKENDTNNNL